MLSMLLSITATLCAQWPFDPVPPPESQLFELPYFSIGSAWHFDLGKGNYLELELADNSQLSRFLNVDSMLLVFLDDMKPFRDSLSDPVSGKRIDKSSGITCHEHAIGFGLRRAEIQRGSGNCGE